MTTKSEASIASYMIEAYGNRTGQYVRIGEIATKSGLTAEEIQIGTEYLMEEEDFQAEPETLMNRATEADRKFAPMIGGEPCHLIRWTA